MAIIGSIRRQSWIAVVVVGVALAAFIISDLGKSNSKVHTNVGSLGGEEISYNEFDFKVKEMESNYMMQQNKEQITSEEHFSIQESAWNEIIESRILAKEYKKLGLVVSPLEVNDMFYGDFIHPYLAQNFTDKNTGVYNRQQVIQIINNYDQLPKEGQKEWSQLEKLSKEERLSSKYSILLAKSFYTPLALGNYRAKVLEQVADVRYIVSSFSEIPDDKVTLTDADYQKYYDDHKMQFKQEDSRDIAFVAFPLVPSAKDLTDIEESVKKTFEEFQQIENNDMASFVTSESENPYDSTFRKEGSFNPAIDSLITRTSAGTFIPPFISGNEWIMAKVMKFENRPDSLRVSLIPIFNNKKHSQFSRTEEEAKQLADSLLAELKKNPALFETFVNDYSDDPSLKEKAGDLGWALEGALGLLNDKILASKEGDLFIQEEQPGTGYYIVKVTGKTPELRKARVALITREILPSEQTRKEIYGHATKFAADSRTIDEMTENAKKHGYAKRDADFTQVMANRLPGVQDARPIIRWAFEDGVKKGDVAANIFEANDMYIVAGLKEIRAKGYAKLEQVKQYLEAPVKIEKKAEILIESAKKAIADGKDINTIASKLNKVVDTITGVSFSEYSFGKNGPEMAVLGTIAATSTSTLLDPIKGYNGVYTIYVDNIRKNESTMDPKMFVMQAEMQNQQKTRSLMDVLKEKAKVADQRHIFY